MPALVKAKPENRSAPFSSAIAKLGLEPLLKVIAATITVVDVDAYRDEVVKWIARRA